MLLCWIDGVSGLQFTGTLPLSSIQIQLIRQCLEWIVDALLHYASDQSKV